MITLGIIGIVAAMTMPALLTRSNEKENVTKLKKVYSVMSQAYMMAKNEFGPMDTWGLESQYVQDDEGNNVYNKHNSLVIIKKMAPYLKTTKICETEKGCWYPDNVIGLNGSAVSGHYDGDDNSRTALVLSDGSLISFVGVSNGCNSNRGKGFLKNTCAVFAVDTNGWKRPNRLGHDVFQFYMTREGIVPYGTQQENDWKFPQDCNSSSSGWGCTAWVIYSENMDYLHCDGLSWEGKKKCK